MAVQRTAAKVNLYLHITGRREDGFHLLDSLVAFADAGDDIAIAEGHSFSVTIDGAFAGAVDSRPDLTEQAARELAEATGHDLDFAITVTKNLPVAAGIGGGSGDAATMLRILCKRWGLKLDDPRVVTVAEKLGADVPICLFGKAAYIDGVGERFYPALGMPVLPCVLVNRGVAVATPAVFRAFDGKFRDPDRAQVLPRKPEALAALLSARQNSLEAPAMAVDDGIGPVLDALRSTDPLLARMSGSGGTCFALYGSMMVAEDAAETLSSSHPDWWVAACRLR